MPTRLFSREAVTLIHEYSGGIPRAISVICDNALVSGMAMERQPVDRAVVLEVCRDFCLRPDLGRVSRPPTPAFDDADDLANQDPSDQADDEVLKMPVFAGRVLKPRRFSLFGFDR